MLLLIRDISKDLIVYQFFGIFLFLDQHRIDLLLVVVILVDIHKVI